MGEGCPIKYLCLWGRNCRKLYWELEEKCRLGRPRLRWAVNII